MATNSTNAVTSSMESTDRATVPESAPRARVAGEGGVKPMPGADSLMEAGPVAGSSPLQSIREDTVRAGITALKADETATVLEREAETVSREVSEKLDDVQRLLRDQQQLERERWEELVKRQREDLIRLKTQDLELANEVDFLRARLDRVSAERDRAIHAAQSAREKDLERQLAERTAEVQKQATRIQSLQDAVQRLETQVEMRTTRAIRELEAKHAQEKKQLADEWTVRLTEIKNTNAGRIEALQEDLARAREEVTAVRKEMEENKVLDADYKSRIQALQGSIDKLSDENSRLKERSNELTQTRRELSDLVRAREADRKQLNELSTFRANYSKLLMVDRQHVDELNELTEQVKILQKRITTLLEERAELEDRMRKQPEPVEESAEFKEAAEEIQAASSIGEGGGAPPVIAPTKPTETNRVTGDTETGVIPTTGPVAA